MGEGKDGMRGRGKGGEGEGEGRRGGGGRKGAYSPPLPSTEKNKITGGKIGSRGVFLGLEEERGEGGGVVKCDLVGNRK